MSEYWEGLLSQHHEYNAPFVCNVEFTAPSRFKEVTKKVVAKNVNHINYIATRPGVETIEEGQNQSQLNDPAEFDMQKYLSYVDERIGSHGLFSASDESPSVKAVQEEIADHKGVVWRIVLSLTEEDAQRLNHASRSEWETTLRATVPEAAAKMGIGETNLRWVAAFHQEVGHPHVHIALWEKDPKRRKGVLNPKEMEGVKKAFQNVVYAEERSLLFQEKTEMRDLINELSKKELVDAVSVVRDIIKYKDENKLEADARGAASVGIAPKLHNENAKEISHRLNEIGSMMPDKGRIAYKLMPEQVKVAVDDTTKWLIQQPAFYDSVRRYKQAVVSMTKHYSFKEDDIQAAVDNAMKDMEKRVSQLVLKAAAEGKKKVFLPVNEEKAFAAVQQFSVATGKPNDTQPLEVAKRSVEALRALGFEEVRIEFVFKEWLRKADLRVTESEIRDLIYDNDSIASDDQEEPAMIEKNARAVANILRLVGRTTDQIKEVLDKSELQEERITEILSDSSKIEKEAKTFLLREDEWKRFALNTGIQTEYPWEMVEKTTVRSELRDTVLNEFRNGAFPAAVADHERSYTAYCMTVTLKTMGVTRSERADIMREFAKRNGLSDIENILGSVNKVETNYLRKETWGRIMANLNSDIKYPWETSHNLELNDEKYQSASMELKTARLPLTNEDEIKWTAEKYAKWLMLDSDPEHAKRELISWGQRTGNLEESTITDMDLFKKRLDDVKIMGKEFGIKDPVYETISNLTKVLVAAGLDPEQVNKFIHDWNERSGANINPEILDKVILNTEKLARDAASWGRSPMISRDKFKDLNTTLGTDAKYIWGNSYDHNQGGAGFGNAKQIWKAIWRSLEQERSRNQAEGEMIKRQQERQRQRAAEREHNDD